MGWHAGIAGRCFKLSHPLHDGHEHVVLWVQPTYGGGAVLPEVVIVPATKEGVCAESWLRRRPGSHVIHEEPVTVDAQGNAQVDHRVVHNAYRDALKILGYELEVEDAHG
jgi:hypothetical protein